MEDVRQYGIDLEDTLRIEPDDATWEWDAASEDELPFEIPRD